MTELRSAVYRADEQNGDVEAALQALRAHVNGHMNTELSGDSGVYPPIQLKHTYGRLLQTEQERANAVNSKIYTDAQHHCEQKFPGSFSGGPRVPCIAEYVKQYGTSARSIPDAQYKFDFASPNWSPDLAGWLVVLSIMLILLTLLRLAAGIFLRRLVK
ncbi:MAG TPA: hypothetical protein VJ836_02315 [Candidatus Saccharimonadales bacterium]|nr:hypothetical protein [Candidatus Saccharimonadales bacterium]